MPSSMRPGPGLLPFVAAQPLVDHHCHAVLGGGGAAGLTAEQALVDAGLFSPAQARELTGQPDTGSCQDMTDLVVERARAARAAEPREWP